MHGRKLITLFVHYNDYISAPVVAMVTVSYTLENVTSAHIRSQGHELYARIGCSPDCTPQDSYTPPYYTVCCPFLSHTAAKSLIRWQPLHDISRQSKCLQSLRPHPLGGQGHCPANCILQRCVGIDDGMRASHRALVHHSICRRSLDNPT